MFIEKIEILLTITIVLLLIQSINSQNCPEGEKLSKKCWQVSCERKVKRLPWFFRLDECSAECECENTWHVRDGGDKCIPVWQCPGICPLNSRFIRCLKNYENAPYANYAYSLEEFKEICEPECECDAGFAVSPNSKGCLKILGNIIKHRPMRFG